MTCVPLNFGPQDLPISAAISWRPSNYVLASDDESRNDTDRHGGAAQRLYEVFRSPLIRSGGIARKGHARAARPQLPRSLPQVFSRLTYFKLRTGERARRAFSSRKAAQGLADGLVTTPFQLCPLPRRHLRRMSHELTLQPGDWLGADHSYRTSHRPWQLRPYSYSAFLPKP